MTRGCDAGLWQPWHKDPGIRTEWTDEGLSLRGTSTLDKRGFSGVTTRRLFPPDACLSADVRIAGSLDFDGKYGTVCHLCNVLLGDEEQVHGLPDNNGEVTYGRCGGRSGWFFWYFNQSEKDFHKWVDADTPRRPFGNEGTAVTVLIKVDGKWVRVPVEVSPLQILEAAGLDSGRHTLSSVHETYTSVLVPTTVIRVHEGQVFTATAQLEAWRNAC